MLLMAGNPGTDNGCAGPAGDNLDEQHRTQFVLGSQYVLKDFRNTCIPLRHVPRIDYIANVNLLALEG